VPLARLPRLLEKQERTFKRSAKDMKLLQNAFFTVSFSLFEDDDGKLWELTQQSDGRYLWFPMLPNEYKTPKEWAKSKADDFAQGTGLLTEKVSSLKSGKYDPPMTHEERIESEK
jgi:hypothetical protein